MIALAIYAAISTLVAVAATKVAARHHAQIYALTLEPSAAAPDGASRLEVSSGK